MLTLQLPPGGLTQPIFTHLCQIPLGWGLYKASVLSKHMGREAPDLGDRKPGASPLHSYALQLTKPLFGGLSRGQRLLSCDSDS